jgi:hypothetical protein
MVLFNLLMLGQTIFHQETDNGANPTLPHTVDIVLSILLLLVTIAFVALFILITIRYVREQIRKAQREKKMASLPPIPRESVIVPSMLMGSRESMIQTDSHGSTAASTSEDPSVHHHTRQSIQMSELYPTIALFPSPSSSLTLSISPSAHVADTTHSDTEPTRPHARAQTSPQTQTTTQPVFSTTAFASRFAQSLTNTTAVSPASLSSGDMLP